MEILAITKIQIIAVVGSVLMLGFIIELIRRKKIREEYGLLWLASGFILLVLSAWQSALHFLSTLVGIHYPPAFLLLVLVMAIFGILIHYSLVITKLTDKNKTLVQELSLLKREVKEIKSKIDSSSDES